MVMLKSSVVTLRYRIVRTFGPRHRAAGAPLGIFPENRGVRPFGGGAGAGLRKWFDSQNAEISENAAIDLKVQADGPEGGDNTSNAFFGPKKLLAGAKIAETTPEELQELQKLVYFWAQHDLSHATSVLQLALGRYDSPISNEVWACYVAKVCEQCHLEGARTAYHELVDNWRLFAEDTSPSSSAQTRFPFLLTPTMLEGLSVVFQRHGEPDYIIGIRDYLKRFFSIYGHRTSYKTISVSLVEAYSVRQEFSNALSSFRFFCMMFRDHWSYAPRQRFLEALHTAAKGSYDWRTGNLRRNAVKYPEYQPSSALDNVQKRFMDQIKGALYDPINTHNETTRMLPTINGALQLNDLPNFSTLLNQYVAKHMEKNDENKVQKLLHTIQQTHFMLNSFVINSLAVNFYLEEAFLIMKKLPYKNHDRLLPALLKNDMFLVVMKSCKAKLATLLSNELSHYERITELTALMNSIMNFYYRVNDKATEPHYDSQVVATFVSAMLSTPRLSTSLLLEHLNKYKMVCKRPLELDQESHNTVVDLFEAAISNDLVAVRKPL